MKGGNCVRLLEKDWYTHTRELSGKKIPLRY